MDNYSQYENSINNQRDLHATEAGSDAVSGYVFCIDEIMGSVEPKTFRKFENGRMVTYSYAIHRDRNGSETHRTKPTALGSIGYDNGEPFREEDYNQIMTGEPKRGFWRRLFA